MDRKVDEVKKPSADAGQQALEGKEDAIPLPADESGAAQ